MKRLVLLLVIIALGVGGYLLYGKYHNAPTDRIVVSGNIELEQVNIAFKTAGRVVERTVDEGDKVTKGQVIARLDKDQLIQQRAREQAALLEAQAAYSAAQTGLEMQTQTSAADMEARQADLTTSQSHLAELKSGARPQEIAEARRRWPRRNRITTAPRRTGIAPRRCTRTTISPHRNTTRRAAVSRVPKRICSRPSSAKGW